MRSALHLAVVPAFLTLLCQAPAAAPLEPAACEQLRQEVSALEKAGARANFSKGTGWAMANLKPDQISQVEKLIEADAQYMFRCPQPKRQFDAATEALMENGTGSDPEPDAAKAAAAAPVTPKPAVPKAAAKPKPTPKAKPVDAYIPPEQATSAAVAPAPKPPAQQ